MTNRLRSFLLAAAVGLALGALGTPARAFASDVTIYFTGECSDCTGDVTATLVLDDGFTPPGEALFANFVSFTYDGSNLIPGGFTLDPSIVGVFLANLTTLPGANFVNIAWLPPGDSVSGTFSTDASGNWSVVLPTGGGDMGTNGS